MGHSQISRIQTEALQAYHITYVAHIHLLSCVFHIRQAVHIANLLLAPRLTSATFRLALVEIYFASPGISLWLSRSGSRTYSLLQTYRLVESEPNTNYSDCSKKTLYKLYSLKELVLPNAWKL